ASTISDSPSVVVLANSPRQHGRRNRSGHRVKLDVVKAHRIAATFGAVVNASYGYDVIETRTNLCIHAGQAELRRRDGFIRLSRAVEDLRLDSHALEIDFDAVARIRLTCIHIERLDSNRH